MAAGHLPHQNQHKAKEPSMTLDTLLPLGLRYGLLLSVVLSSLILASLYINPTLWLHDAPAEIQARVGPVSEATKRQRSRFAWIFFGMLLAILAAGLFQLRTQTGDLTFGGVFLLLYIMLMLFNLTDLLVIDWLIIETIRPAFTQLPGLGELAAVRHYGFHLRQFLVGTVGLLALSLLLAASVAWLF
jgi:hypothetical protein